MVVPHSGGYPNAKFEGNLLLFKFGPHTKSGLTTPQCVWGQRLRGDFTRPTNWYLCLLWSHKLGSSTGMIQKAISFRRFDHSKRKREGRKILNGDRESHFPSQIVSSSRGRQNNASQVWWILFLLLLTTSAWTCLKDAHNPGSTLLATPVLAEIAKNKRGGERRKIRSSIPSNF